MGFDDIVNIKFQSKNKFICFPYLRIQRRENAEVTVLARQFSHKLCWDGCGDLLEIQYRDT